MLLSLNWLKDYIDIPKNVTAEKLAHDLTIATVEVEKTYSLAEQFENMVIGRIVIIKKHPKADKLKLVMVDVGKEKSIQIVCGGKNLKQDMLVPVALPDAKVRWHGEGEPVVLEKTKIRGETSYGMICASNEIGLESRFPCSEMEITDLTNLKDIKPGELLAQALGMSDGIIIEIDNKSLTNRPDLCSHYGIAREIAAIYNLKLKDADQYSVSECPVSEKDILDIEIKDKNLCPRYIGCLVKNIKIAPSPDWLRQRLEAVGLRAINNIVDITNYVLMDIGEPTHAFDAVKLGNKIIVRSAIMSEKIKTLDGENRRLDEKMLVIADSQKPVALAGVMGGASTEVSDNTKEIVLEAAIFDPVSIRKTSVALNHRTESSIRFEKNLDPNLAETAMLRMLKLIKDFIPQSEIEILVDKNYAHKEKKVIKIEHSFIEKRIGQKFNSKEIVKILERLGFIIKENKNLSSMAKAAADKHYTIEVPSWRATGDVSIPEDIVEEVARIYGYDKLEPKREFIEFEKAKYQPKYELENKIKDYLSLTCSLTEVFNYPWTEEKILKKLGLNRNLLEISNPPAEENKYLQNSLIPNLIKNVQDNLRFASEFKLFELARVFKGSEVNKWSKEVQDTLPEQPKMLAAAVVAEGKKDVFRDTKGIVESIMKKLHVSNYKVQINSKSKIPNYLNKNKYLKLVIDDQIIGWLGEYQEKIKNKNIALFEINWDKLVEMYCNASLMKRYQALPQHPSIQRDIAIEVGWEVTWSEVKDGILRCAQDDILNKVSFLSEYDLGNKKSLAFRVTYQADRTLKDEEVEVVEKKIINLLEKKFEASLRR